MPMDADAIKARIEAALPDADVLMIDLAERQARGDFAYRDNVSADCSEIIGYTKA